MRAQLQTEFDVRRHFFVVSRAQTSLFQQKASRRTEVRFGNLTPAISTF